MPKLVSHEDDVLIYDVRRHWSQDGHEVAWMRLTNKQVPESASCYLMCECDFADGPRVIGGPGDPDRCEAKKAVRNVAVMGARRTHGDAWKKMGSKEALLDIHRRVKADELLGQLAGGVIYTQQVAQLLDLGHEQVLAACGELYAEERLDLNGRILTDFIPCFRFPSEMQSILRYIVEEPLGWPNGDAGDCWLAGFEREIQERLGFASGKRAFGKHWPRIDGAILAEYALEPVAAKLRQVAPLVPEGPMTDARAALLAIDAMGDAMIGEHLRKLEVLHPEIAATAFGEFIRGLFLLAFERVEMERQMRTVQVPSAQTLVEMAAFLERNAAHVRAEAAEKT